MNAPFMALGGAAARQRYGGFGYRPAYRARGASDPGPFQALRAMWPEMPEMTGTNFQTSRPKPKKLLLQDYAP